MLVRSRDDRKFDFPVFHWCALVRYKEIQYIYWEIRLHRNEGTSPFKALYVGYKDSEISSCMIQAQTTHMNCLFFFFIAMDTLVSLKLSLNWTASIWFYLSKFVSCSVCSSVWFLPQQTGSSLCCWDPGPAVEPGPTESGGPGFPHEISVERHRDAKTYSRQKLRCRDTYSVFTCTSIK